MAWQETRWWIFACGKNSAVAKQLLQQRILVFLLVERKGLFWNANQFSFLSSRRSLQLNLKSWNSTGGTANRRNKQLPRWIGYWFNSAVPRGMWTQRWRIIWYGMATYYSASESFHKNRYAVFLALTGKNRRKAPHILSQNVPLNALNKENVFFTHIVRRLALFLSVSASSTPFTMKAMSQRSAYSLQLSRVERLEFRLLVHFPRRQMLYLPLSLTQDSSCQSLLCVKKKFVVCQTASSGMGMRERGGGGVGSRETSSKTNWLEGPHWIKDTDVLTYLRLGDSSFIHSGFIVWV